MNQFGSAKPVQPGTGHDCAQCEAMLADAIDGTIAAAAQAAFDRHIATCEVCSEMLADAQRGAALLSMLKTQRPEPPAALLERIFAQTSGVPTASAATPIRILPRAVGSLPAAGGAEVAAFTAAGAQTAPYPGNVLLFRSRLASHFNLRAFGQAMLQPRLAMTAAMAFFSIALTLNLTGVHLNELKASDLKPSNLKRSLYDADARAVRYYENLRVVYELESRVRDLQRANDNDTPATPAPKASGSDGSQPEQQKQQKQERPKPESGTSQRQSLMPPAIRLAADHAPETRPQAVLPSIVSSNSFLQVHQFEERFPQFKEQVSEGGLV
ncbi:MAG TPA: zf-HC2 domain-containing protein [Granulicella sp.]|nr:zf-HC2 domain-containing protein [Granulicella sp.]